MSNDETLYTLAGIYTISKNIPSFATPIFRSIDSEFDYIQNSSSGLFIDRFVPLPKKVSDRDQFVTLNYNESFLSSSEFLIGFIDHEMLPRATTRLDLLNLFEENFDEYRMYPYVQWTAIRLSKKRSWIDKLAPESVEVLCTGMLGTTADVEMSYKTSSYYEPQISSLKEVGAYKEPEMNHERTSTWSSYYLRSIWQAYKIKPKDRVKFTAKGIMRNELAFRLSQSRNSKTKFTPKFTDLVDTFNSSYDSTEDAKRKALKSYFDILSQSRI